MAQAGEKAEWKIQSVRASTSPGPSILSEIGQPSPSRQGEPVVFGAMNLRYATGQAAQALKAVELDGRRAVPAQIRIGSIHGMSVHSTNPLQFPQVPSSFSAQYHQSFVGFW